MNNDLTDDKETAYLKRRAEMLRLLERHLHAERTAPTLAEQAFLSRFHFGREFRRVIGEAPGVMGRRLRLERAAHNLRTTQWDIMAIALDAGYDSVEGFSRAFRRAYGCPPSRYRALAVPLAPLPSINHVHYDPQTRGLRTETPKGETAMDLTDRLIDTDYWIKKRLLESALTLTDVQLDAPLVFRHTLIPFAEPERTLREALSRMTGDGWLIGMMDAGGWSSSDIGYRQSVNYSVHEMLTRLEGFHRDYTGFITKIKTENLWEAEWLDVACEPAETFTYGGTIEASLTWGITQRMVVKRLLEQLGLPWSP